MLYIVKICVVTIGDTDCRACLRLKPRFFVLRRKSFLFFMSYDGIFFTDTGGRDMKRRGSIALCVLMLSAICALGLSACETETGQPEHIHTFSQEWTYSDTHHWHVAICGHEDEVSDYAEHIFQSGACTVCACPQPSAQGLEYTLINGDTAYEVRTPIMGCP